MQGLGFNEVEFSPDPWQRYVNAKLQATQLGVLLNAINAENSSLTAKMERYLASASIVSFASGGSIKTVFEVLMNHKIRAKYIELVPAELYERMEEYIESLQELDKRDKDDNIIGTRDSEITGIIDRLYKLKQNPYMEEMLKIDTSKNINLVDEIQKNQLICLKMPEEMFPTDSERDIYTTYWISKIYLALQVRGTKIKDRSKLTKLNMIIDELYQVRHTEKFITEKLSRLPKFGVKPIISCHYLNQLIYLREELRAASASYMLVSGCDKKNYHEFKSELYPFEEDDLLKLPRFHSMNLLKCKDGYSRFITKLPPPVSNQSAPPVSQL
jgi:hypothetical protein